jgi:hypothetical protein
MLVVGADEETKLEKNDDSSTGVLLLKIYTTKPIKTTTKVQAPMIMYFLSIFLISIFILITRKE